MANQKKVDYTTDPQWQEFKEAFLKKPDLKAAATKAGIKPEVVYRLRSKDKAFNKWLASEAEDEVNRTVAEMDALLVQAIKGGDGLDTAMHRTLKLAYERTRIIETKTDLNVHVHSGEPVGGDNVMDSLLEDLKKHGIITSGRFN